MNLLSAKMHGAITVRQFYSSIDRTVEQIHGISDYKLDPALLKILFLMGLPDTEQWSRFKTQQYLTADDNHETKLKAAGFSDDNVLGGGSGGRKKGALGFFTPGGKDDGPQSRQLQQEKVRYQIGKDWKRWQAEEQGISVLQEMRV